MRTGSIDAANISQWHDARWGDKDDRVVAAKLAEETGEVCGALIKHHEGRRTLDDVQDELGDVLVVMSVLAGRHGWTLGGLLRRRFAEVSGRTSPDHVTYVEPST